MEELLAVEDAAREVAALAEPLARAGSTAPGEGECLLRAVAVLLGEVDRARRGRLVWPVGSLPHLLARLADVLDGLPAVLPTEGPALPRVREARRLCEAARVAARR